LTVPKKATAMTSSGEPKICIARKNQGYLAFFFFYGSPPQMGFARF
jgi:hypothetical protein